MTSNTCPPAPPGRRAPRAALAAALLIATLGVAFGRAIGHAEQPPHDKGAPAPAKNVALPSVAPLAAQVMPSVVSIEVDEAVKPDEEDQSDDAPGALPFFRHDRRQPQPRRHAHGLGSGVVLDSKGLILTNAHVVEDATTIRVTVDHADGSEVTMRGKVIGIATEYDVALVETEKALDAPAASLGDSDALQIGDWVMAIGNPFGLPHSASVGIISAKNRRDVMPSGREGIYNFLQTDASINPGNSGGPLINMHGEVVGLNSAMTASGQGIGFAIPINMVRAILPQLKSTGHFARSWLGVKVQPMTPELAQTFGLDNPRGVLVSDVMPESPAAAAGFKPGDIILEFEGKKLQQASDLTLAASMAGVGKNVSMVVLRNGKSEAKSIKLGAFPQTDTSPTPPAATGKEGLGLQLMDITPELRQRLDLPPGAGVLVRAVAADSGAASAGIERGDVIRTINGEPVSSSKQLQERIKAIKTGQVFRLQVSREDSEFFAALRKP
jgi:serine protease Do